MVGRAKIVIPSLAVVALAGGGVYWFLRSGEEPEPPPAPAAVEPSAPIPPPVTSEEAAEPEPAPAPAPLPAPTLVPTPKRAPEPAPPVNLPVLDDSDAFVRERLPAGLPNAWRQWLARDELIRWAAVLLENASRGELPKRAAGPLVPAAKFATVQEGERAFMAAASFARYDPVVGALDALPPERAAALFKLLDPLLSEAIGELGAYRPPVALLDRAITLVLRTPVLTERPVLVRHRGHYRYADERLEALAPLQKLLLRAGPANLAKAQSYARELRDAL